MIAFILGALLGVMTAACVTLYLRLQEQGPTIDKLLARSRGFDEYAIDMKAQLLRCRCEIAFLQAARELDAADQEVTK